MTTRSLQVTRAGTMRGLPERLSYPPGEMIGTHPQAVVFRHQNTGNTGGAAVARPKKYRTEKERREARRQSQRKYFEANREAIRARQAERRDRQRRAAMKAVRKATQTSPFERYLRPNMKAPAPLHGHPPI